jgi:hypothetical protein
VSLNLVTAISVKEGCDCNRLYVQQTLFMYWCGKRCAVRSSLRRRRGAVGRSLTDSSLKVLIWPSGVLAQDNRRGIVIRDEYAGWEWEEAVNAKRSVVAEETA